MTRIVVDTNVFVSSFFGGKPKQIIDLWRKGAVTLCLSTPIIEEHVDVLRRMGLQDDPELKRLLNIFARNFNAVFAATTPSLRVVSGDSDDDKFVECAVALDARAIVSGDKALVGMRNYMGIEILTPAQFLSQQA